MIDGLVFPDVREAMSDLIDGTTHGGEPVRAVWHLPADSFSNPSLWPMVLIYTPDGTEGFIDRVDRVTLECYAPGTEAVNTLESIKALICGTDIDTPHGFLDSVAPDQGGLPKDVPFQSDTLNKAVASFLVTSRPLN